MATVDLSTESARGGAIDLRRRTGFLLSVLFGDLRKMNSSGIDDPVCDAIKATLDLMAAKDAKANGFASIHWNPRVEVIRNTYLAWNKAAKGDVSKRKTTLVALARKRRRLFSRFGKAKQEALLADLDRAFFLGVLSGFAVLAESHPQVFPELKRHVLREKGKVGR